MILIVGVRDLLVFRKKAIFLLLNFINPLRKLVSFLFYLYYFNHSLQKNKNVLIRTKKKKMKRKLEKNHQKK